MKETINAVSVGLVIGLVGVPVALQAAATMLECVEPFLEALPWSRAFFHLSESHRSSPGYGIDFGTKRIARLGNPMARPSAKRRGFGLVLGPVRD